jgi:DNA-binding NtrC family response regulator
MADDERAIYLVDNDSDALLFLYDFLSAAGFRVAASSNAIDALAYVGRMRPRAILCHWEMPEMDGGEFLDRVKELSPDTRVVVSSPNADGLMYEEVLRRGGHDLVPEPFSQTTVLHAVERVLGLSVPYEGSRRLMAGETASREMNLGHFDRNPEEEQ